MCSDMTRLFISLNQCMGQAKKAWTGMGKAHTGQHRSDMSEARKKEDSNREK